MMLGATERTRGILEYCHSLEDKVRTYQNARRRFQFSIFLGGLVTGGVAMLVLLRYFY